MDFSLKTSVLPTSSVPLLIIFVGVQTAPGLADCGRKSPFRNWGGGESNPSGNDHKILPLTKKPPRPFLGKNS